MFILILVAFSNPGVVGYTVLGYNDVSGSPVVDGLAYSNTALSSCEIELIGINQIGSEAIQQSV